MRFYYHFYLCFIYALVMCEDNGIVKSKNPLPYFRRKVEELTEDQTVPTTVSDDLSLVSFLIKNVKQIYNELDESFGQVEKMTSVRTSTTENTLNDITSNVTKAETPLEYFFDLSTTDVTSLTEPSKMYLIETAVNKNVTLVHFSDTEMTDVELSTTGYELTEKEELMHLSKNLDSYEMDRKQRDNEIHALMMGGNGSLTETHSVVGHFKSCIFCDNVGMEECNDPRNRLIPATVCEREDDLCYSLHTPFGVIDRGCFNANHNLTTYACSCNLCNHLSISEMPYLFSKKQEWIDNVVELSRTRHFRKSVYKDMACLKCESNATTGDMLDTANCLEGNIGSLPTEVCKIEDICAVKAIKKDGYIWRGCVKNPLFNYWFVLCDSDLCNYEPIVSFYDLI